MSLSDHILAAMIDAVIVVDVDTTITTINAGAERLLGYSAGELCGTPLLALLADQEALERTTRMQMLSVGDELRKEEVMFVDRDGRQIPVSITASPVLDAEGDFEGIVFVARDLRETRRLLAELARAKASAEHQLDETRDRLLQAERLSTLGTLAAGVGHELRNLGQLYLGCLAQLPPELDAPLREDLEWVSEHLVSYATHLLELARPRRPRTQLLEIGEVAAGVLEMLRIAGKTKTLLIESSFAEHRPVVIDRTRLEQVLVNLIKNAIDAVDEPGVRERRVRVSIFEEGDRVVCAIADTGCGIPPESREKIFDAFYTTKGPSRGTGLGLPVVKQILERFAGDIVFESTGAGTTMRFSLPIAASAPALSAVS